MLTITGYTAEFIKDPFGILSGERYEFILDIEVPEDDELYSDQGLYLKVIYKVEDERSGIVKADFFEKTTDRYLELEMEDEEKEAVEAFCREHLPEAGK
ncbi:DUF6509 family protein [Paenibacillus sp. P26]|nr:DUF6509 family protein [Paenibacillus sp. P26]UUZ89800.1 DUF6509 family protein [Paenibacillus sp. P25]